MMDAQELLDLRDKFTEIHAVMLRIVGDFDLLDVVNAAMRAERSRCARIVETFQLNGIGMEPSSPARAQLATLIRKEP